MNDNPSVIALPVGIDLGTTYSVVAYVDAAGRPATVPNCHGDALTPSTVFVDFDEIIVGRDATKASLAAPDAYAECFKRDMGRSVYRRSICGVQVPPEVLSAYVLERLKGDAEQPLGRVRQAVITVPAYFDESRRKATQQAGQLAGLEVLDIINEPTAAAVAFGYQQGILAAGQSDVGISKDSVRILVYDLGGGTFDVTIVEIENTRFRAIATDGDVQLGGKDFDERLVDFVAEKFVAAHGCDVRSDRQDAMRLWFDVQELKHTLSARTKGTIICRHAGVQLRVDVRREEFEEITRELLDRTEITTSLVVRQAALEWSQIDRVLLVGGATRMPMISTMLTRLTGKQPDNCVSPDEAVAHGAALYAAMLLGTSDATKAPRLELVNVNSHSLGVVAIESATHRRVNVTLIPRNTALPCRRDRRFHTAVADQRSVKVKIVEGESCRPEECIAIGECVIQGLPAGLPKGTPIDVEYHYQSNGRVAVFARVPLARQSVQVEIARDSGAQMEDLETWRARLTARSSGTTAADTASHGPTSVELSDRGSVLRRLDELYSKLGLIAVGLALPEELSRAKQATVDAAANLHACQDALKELQSRKTASHGLNETVLLSSDLARAKSQAEQAKTQAEFAHLVLGRDCVRAGCCLPNTNAEVHEIELLRDHISRWSSDGS